MKKMKKSDIMVIKEQIEKHHKLKVDEVRGKLIVNIPKHLGMGKKEDKIELVENLMKEIVDNIRQYKSVFDVECDMTYEFIKITFIG